MNSNKPCGTLLAKAICFNDFMDHIKGSALINKDQKDWLWEVEGNPELIDRRLGGQAKQSCDHVLDDDKVDQLHAINTTKNDSSSATKASVTTNDINKATQTPKRIRKSAPSVIAKGPKARNTRPKPINGFINFNPELDILSTPEMDSTNLVPAFSHENNIRVWLDETLHAGPPASHATPVLHRDPPVLMHN
ncbi:uncharacterized protein MELLADRAFT_112430 [Melampsora larici-populina 98AG31]|uniref:Uncharacterized protein n=1 Tax=Melampsora larici-populina (strain 98AG31 / pathotype 3-4-7) TaxID=747676 RepID=F4S6G3_MELLP|nr:uncharacterized protein MELLADRAFT_112430 [Melampsora larici-populina 98AG31]EGF99685.1 hypothetical protein MELLADRAFT_112430 [Melampsora larici-populina 98AG31]